jgi:molybdopterin-synthase adenylyltransferase
VNLGDRELERYARHIVLREVGGPGQRRLKAASVAVVGAGGIGSAVIPALAGAGIGRLTIIDFDRVELANLQRQTLFTEGDVGREKVAAAAEFVIRLNSFVDVTPLSARVDPTIADALLGGHALVIDGTDNFAARLAVSDACVRLRIPLVSAAAVMFQGQVGLFRGRPCYRCWVGDAFDSDDCDTCAEQGVLGALTHTVGGFAALMAARTLMQVGDDPAGRIYLFNGLRLSWRSLNVPPDPGCAACAS